MSPESENTQPDDDEASLISWEKENFVPIADQDEIETMWEFSQICHFLNETKEELNLPEISIYEVERMLLMPKASKQLAAIMTCLLCSPDMQTKLRKIPSMPYEFWTSTLMQKCKKWFKIYENQHRNARKVQEETGLEPTFWKIFTDYSEIDQMEFEDFTLKQKVWLLKSLCDICSHKRKAIQKGTVKNSEKAQNDMILGVDRFGNTFFYLKQFADRELRVYKHKKAKEILETSMFQFAKLSSVAEAELDKKLSNNIIPERNPAFSDMNINLSDNATDSTNLEIKKTESTLKPGTKSDKHRRKRGWKNGILPKIKKKNKVPRLTVSNLKNGGDNGCPTDDSQCSSNVSLSNDVMTATQDESSVVNDVMDSLLLKVEGSEEKTKKENSEEISNDEPLDPIALLLKNTECSLVSLKKSKVTKCNETKIETKTNSDDDLKDKLSETTMNESEIKMEVEGEDGRSNFWYLSQSFLNCESRCETFLDENKYQDFLSQSGVEENSDWWKDIDESVFELVADSVESLRDFIVIFATEHGNNFDAEDTHKVGYEHKLLKKLCLLVEELVHKEEFLKEVTSKARRKLCTELRNFQNGINEESSWLGENGTYLNWWIVGSKTVNCANSQDSERGVGDTKKENDINEKCASSSENNPSTSNNCDNTAEQDEEEKSSSDREEEQQSKRVLRTRGVSSYTGHFYMDDSDEETPHENVLDSNSNASTISSPNAQNLNAELSQESDSEEDDSDGEWVLPGSRKKKKKRGRRSKNLQYRLHVVPMNNMMGDQFNYNNNSLDRHNSASSSSTNDHSTKDHEVDVKPDISKINLNLNYGNPPLKKELERVDSIHSELDIPEEKPVIDPVTGAIKTPMVPKVIRPRRPNNVPVVSSNVLITRPLHLPPQYRAPIRQPMMAPRQQIVYPPSYNQAYNPRPQPVYYRPQSYRNALPGVDSMMMHPRTSQQPMQMPQQILRPRLPMRMPRAPATRYRAVPMQQNPRMRALVPATRAPYNPRIPQAPQPRRALRPPAPSAAPKSTSLIVLSDSDDEIEMTIIEKGNTKQGTAAKPKAQASQKPALTQQDVVNSVKSILPSQVVQRINQGGISITPVKKNQPKTTPTKTNPPAALTTNPQLVVVVNETGSHYALALPNGSKLILTPEQVAQIRASNGGTLSV